MATATINGIKVEGTPEEIAKIIQLLETKVSGGEIDAPIINYPYGTTITTSPPSTPGTHIPAGT